MSLLDLQDWLIADGIKADIDELARLTVLTEIDNLVVPASSGERKSIEWERLLLAGSILARSAARKHQEAALRIATAALTLETPQAVRDAGAVLLDKLSNHRAIGLAEARERLTPGLDVRLGLSMQLEAQRRKIENAILVRSSGNWIPVNDFQLRFWRGAAGDHNWLSASAPTASGKTFLVLQWLIDQMLVSDAQVAVYLAPTRALVSEIEGNLAVMLKATDLIDVTSLPLREKYNIAIQGGRKLILVFTQERLHLLINILGEVKIHLLIVDEAHKIGDRQRGVVLQDVIERVSRTNRDMKVVFISPATQNPECLLEDAPEGTRTIAIDSDVPTVLQNVIVAEQVPRKPKEWSLTLRLSDASTTAIGTLCLANKPAGLKKRLAFIAAAAGARGGTLIYTNGAAEAEDVALLVSQLVNSKKSTDPELLALADLARKGVHRNYALAPLVERGVAFHYGNMPSLIRVEIERLFRIGKIRFLTCTSTLIEGVNLSCRTIVVRGPRKGVGKPMEPHDFWNLAGRAGRWGNEFQGNIICIDPHDDRAWPTGVPERARYPIKRETDAVMGLPGEMVAYLQRRRFAAVDQLEDADQFEQVSAYLLTTYLRLGSLLQAGFAKRHDAQILTELDASLAQLATEIDISAEVAAKHPGVSVVGLQRLLNVFRSYEGDLENLLPAPSESVDAYDRFVTIMRRININVFPAFQPDGLVPLHALIVLEWLKGLSLSAIIKRRIKYQDENNKPYKLPVLIRDTMEIVEQTARFRAPKYLSAYIDILKMFLIEAGREDLIDAELDMGIALEFGVSSLTLLSLMELGLSRMSAVALYEKIAKDDLDKAGCLSWFNEHNSQFDGMDIPAIIVKEIREKLTQNQAPQNI